jgi:hypothetical protein
VIEIDEGARWPELLLQLLAGDDFAEVLKERSQDLEGLLLESYLGAIAAQLIILFLIAPGSQSLRRVRPITSGL